MVRTLLAGILSLAALAQAPDPQTTPNQSLNATEILPDHRAVFRTGFSNRDEFVWIGVSQERLNASVNSDFKQRIGSFFPDPAKTSKQSKLFWIAGGNDYRVVNEGPKRFSDTVKAHPIRREYHETDGGHTWITGRMY